MLTRKDVEDWLSKYCPTVRLVKYGGKVKAKSTFYTTEYDRTFVTTFGNIKTAVRRGRGVGRPKEAVQEAKRRTWRRKYGVDHPKRAKTVQDKYKDTCQEKYGSDNYFGSAEWKDRAREVYEDALGVANPAHHSEILRKIRATNFERYGASTYAEGTAEKYDGKTVAEISEDSGLSRAWIHRQLSLGVDPELVERETRTTEEVIRRFLDGLDVEVIEDRKCRAGIRPDFYLPEHELAIECDGVYYHSDVFLSKNWHKIRREKYLDSGITPLFFREDELLQKGPIIESIIANKLGMSTRVFARKTTVGRLPSSKATEFLRQNHLMGPGKGRSYGLWDSTGLVSLMQVKWKKTEACLEISRFSHRLRTTVVGGFSRLLKYAILHEKPDYIRTFIDLRYGSGSYLPELGFRKISEYVSFRWAKNTRTVHRMTYPGNTGYDHGFRKIWDCGQAQWELEV